MRSSIVPAVAVAMAFASTDWAAAQNQVRFVGHSAAPRYRTAQRIDLDGPAVAPPAPAEPIAVGEPAPGGVPVEVAGDMAGGGGWVPAEMSSPIAAGAAYSVDLRNLYPNQVWPGVPPCCDPWLGYCHEPRCYGCWRGQGYYTWYNPHACDKCGGGGEYIQYLPGFKKDKNCAGGCYGGACSGGCKGGACGNCPTCKTGGKPCVRTVSTGTSDSNSCVTSVPAEGTPSEATEPAAPRNEIPTKAAGANARRAAPRVSM